MKSISIQGLVLLAASALSGGCTSFPSISTGTPAQQVQALVGSPDQVWKNPDGSEVWEYPQGPMGTETFMVSFGDDRTVREVRQVLNEETISKLRVGMSRDEVRRMIGKPRDIGYSDRTDEEIWSWLYREWRSRKMQLHVQFDRPTGLVKGISRFQIDPADSRRR
jgi:hypothetical protein